MALNQPTFVRNSGWGRLLRWFDLRRSRFGKLILLLLLAAPVGGSGYAAGATKLWSGLVEVSIPAGVQMSRSGSVFNFRAAGEAASTMQLTIQRVSRPGLKYAGDLYNATYERVKKSGGYRVTGETSSGPTTGESCEIRYLVKSKADRSRLHQVRESHVKVRGSEWVQARLTARSVAWNSRAAKNLRGVLASLKVGGR